MRQQIIDSIITQIQQITGITTVRSWYVDQITDDMLPFVNVCDKDDDISRDGGIDHHVLELQIDIYAANITSLRQYMDGVMAAVYKLDIINDAIWEKTTITAEGESTVVYCASLTYSVFYSTNEKLEVVQC